MATRENDSKAGRLSKRINFLKRVTKGGKGNILHAMDMVIEELPEGYRAFAFIIKAQAEGELKKIEDYLETIDEVYETLKALDPEYQPKHKPKKRKAKGN